MPGTISTLEQETKTKKARTTTRPKPVALPWRILFFLATMSLPKTRSEDGLTLTADNANTIDTTDQFQPYKIDFTTLRHQQARPRLQLLENSQSEEQLQYFSQTEFLYENYCSLPNILGNSSLSKQEKLKLLRATINNIKTQESSGRLDKNNNNLRLTLQIAVLNNMPDVVELLLHAGADPDMIALTDIPLLDNSTIKGVAGKSLLHMAIHLGYHEIAIMLVNYNANVNIVDAKQNTPMHFMARIENPSAADIELITILIEHGAKIYAENIDKHQAYLRVFHDAQGNIQTTPNLHILNAKLYRVLTRGNLKAARKAIKAGADVNCKILTNRNHDKSAENMPLLALIALNGQVLLNKNFAIFELLLKNGANPDELLAKGNTLLHTFAAIDYQNVPEDASNTLIDLLFKYGANPNLQNDSGDTAMHAAAGKGKFEAVKKLSAAGAFSDIKNNKGLMSTDVGTPQINAYLKVHGKDFRSIEEIPKHITIETTTIIGATDYEIQPERSKSPKKALPQDESVDVALNELLQLLGDGYRTLVKDKDRIGRIREITKYIKTVDPTSLTHTNPKATMAIQIAVFNGYTDALEVLLDSGLNPNIIFNRGLPLVNSKPLSERNGQTLLHAACARGHKGVFDTLVKHGASLNVQDSNGNTPLHLLAAKPKTATSIDMIASLIDRGADIYIKNLRKEPAYRQANGNSGNINDITKDMLLLNQELLIAITKGNLARVKKAIKHGADIDTINLPEGKTPIEAARNLGHDAIASYLEKLAQKPIPQKTQAKPPLQQEKPQETKDAQPVAEPDSAFRVFGYNVKAPIEYLIAATATVLATAYMLLGRNSDKKPDFTEAEERKKLKKERQEQKEKSEEFEKIKSMLEYRPDFAQSLDNVKLKANAINAETLDRLVNSYNRLGVAIIENKHFKLDYKFTYILENIETFITNKKLGSVSKDEQITFKVEETTYTFNQISYSTELASFSKELYSFLKEKEESYKKLIDAYKEKILQYTNISPDANLEDILHQKEQITIAYNKLIADEKLINDQIISRTNDIIAISTQASKYYTTIQDDLETFETRAIKKFTKKQLEEKRHEEQYRKGIGSLNQQLLDRLEKKKSKQQASEEKELKSKEAQEVKSKQEQEAKDKLNQTIQTNTKQAEPVTLQLESLRQAIDNDVKDDILLKLGQAAEELLNLCTNLGAKNAGRSDHLRNAIFHGDPTKIAAIKLDEVKSIANDYLKQMQQAMDKIIKREENLLTRQEEFELNGIDKLNNKFGFVPGEKGGLDKIQLLTNLEKLLNQKSKTDFTIVCIGETAKEFPVFRGSLSQFIEIRNQLAHLHILTDEDKATLNSLKDSAFPELVKLVSSYKNKHFVQHPFKSGNEENNGVLVSASEMRRRVGNAGRG